MNETKRQFLVEDTHILVQVKLGRECSIIKAHGTVEPTDGVWVC